jgi:methylaspartate mutase sigma subunit
MASDSHTWNLIYLELLMEELGFQVLNLGACVPDELLIEQVEARRPDLLVLSSVNGNGYHEGLRVIDRLRAAAHGSRIPVVIGGKLGIDGKDDHRSRDLMAAGFDAVFFDSSTGPASLVSFIDRHLGPA